MCTRLKEDYKVLCSLIISTDHKLTEKLFFPFHNKLLFGEKYFCRKIMFPIQYSMYFVRFCSNSMDLAELSSQTLVVFSFVKFTSCIFHGRISYLILMVEKLKCYLCLNNWEFIYVYGFLFEKIHF